jgi:hypothetical protein
MATGGLADQQAEGDPQLTAQAFNSRLQAAEEGKRPPRRYCRKAFRPNVRRLILTVDNVTVVVHYRYG